MLVQAIKDAEDTLRNQHISTNTTPLELREGEIFIDNMRLVDHLDTHMHFAAFVPLLLVKDYDLEKILTAEIIYASSLRRGCENPSKS